MKKAMDIMCQKVPFIMKGEPISNIRNSEGDGGRDGGPDAKRRKINWKNMIN